MALLLAGYAAIFFLDAGAYDPLAFLEPGEELALAYASIPMSIGVGLAGAVFWNTFRWMRDAYWFEDLGLNIACFVSGTIFVRMVNIGIFGAAGYVFATILGVASVVYLVRMAYRVVYPRVEGSSAG